MFSRDDVELAHLLLGRLDEIDRKLHSLDGKIQTIDAKASAVQGLLIHILQEETAMALDISDLTREVAETKTVQESAVVLLESIVAKLQAAEGDPAAIAAVVAELDASTNALAAAVSANTPAA